MRVGIGFDVHRFEGGIPLIIGGVEIPSDKGLVGHSDADVLIHAVMDAMLGACRAGDIGEYFPDSEPKYKGISSLRLLQRVRDIVSENGYKLVNLDAVLVAEYPKINQYRKEIISNLTSSLEAVPGQINVKGTTTEGLGFTGREEGIAAYAVALLEKI